MKIIKTRNVKTPTRGTSKSAGLDFYIPDDFDYQAGYNLRPGEDINIPSGIHVKIPSGKALINMDKSGRAVNYKLKVGACVIDEDYQGEIHLHLFNIGEGDCMIYPGDKILQALLVDVSYEDVEVVGDLVNETGVFPDSTFEDQKSILVQRLYGGESERGSGGFGSTGLK